MQNNMANPAWTEQAPSVAALGEAARADFIRKTYIHFLGGLMAFSGVIYGMFQNVSLLQSLQQNYLILVIGMFGLAIGYRWLFASANMAVHYVGFALTIGVYAALLAPFFYMADQYKPGILSQAFLITSFGFGGLTAIALMSKKDFSFLGGFLSIATFGLLGVALAGMIFGFGLGSLYSYAALLIFGGWVLYDTSAIKNQLPLNGYVFGATMLFIDFVVMLKHVVFLLLNNDD